MAGPRYPRAKRSSPPHRQVPHGEAGEPGKGPPGPGFPAAGTPQPCAICRSQAGGTPRCMASRSKKRSGPQFVRPAADPLGALLQDGVVVAPGAGRSPAPAGGARSR